MKLTIITINFNNNEGLRKTLESTLIQTYTNFEHCIIDGASSDNSVDIIKDYKERANKKGIKVKWISERDSGIYDAMNKGIDMADGEYIQFLNGGDYLVNKETVKDVDTYINQNTVPIFYGNMLKASSTSKMKRCRGFKGEKITFLHFYTRTLNHPVTFIKKELFKKYGNYDTTLKIVADWEWFLRTVIINAEEVGYYNKDIAIFDVQGISSDPMRYTVERTKVLKYYIPDAILNDYKKLASIMRKIRRIMNIINISSSSQKHQ